MNFVLALIVGFVTYWGGAALGRSAPPERQAEKTALGVLLGSSISNLLIMLMLCFREGHFTFGKAELIVVGFSTLIIGFCCPLVTLIQCSWMPKEAGPSRVKLSALSGAVLAFVGSWTLPLALTFSLVLWT